MERNYPDTRSTRRFDLSACHTGAQHIHPPLIHRCVCIYCNGRLNRCYSDCTKYRPETGLNQNIAFNDIGYRHQRHHHHNEPYSPRTSFCPLHSHTTKFNTIHDISQLTVYSVEAGATGRVRVALTRLRSVRSSSQRRLMFLWNL